MRQAQKLSGLVIGAAAVFCAVEPVWANATPSSASQPDIHIAQRTGTPTTPAATPISQTPANPPPQPSVQVPQPNIRINGNPATDGGAVQPTAPVPPFLPRAIAPPVGDISVSNIDPSAGAIELSTTARVPRLVLKDAPVREVLELLARSAGLNLAFIGGATAGQAAPGSTGVQAASTVTLNLENEPVQNVFNYVLQAAGLQANRIGSTIFVGSELPPGVRGLITRSFRLNQVNASTAAAFLSAQGAESQRVVEQVAISTVGEGAAARNVETRTTTVQPLAATTGTGPLLLRGMSVLTDERLNAITLVGEPRKVQLATSLLVQLDARRRQVAVNVKIIDVNLLNTDTFNTSFSFGVGNSSFGITNGAALFNFGGGNAANPSAFIATLQASISSGNGKVLTDPTLMIQEGERSIVNLSQQVFAGFRLEYQAVGTTTVPVQVPIIRDAGLILDIQVSRIDDNGFVTLAVNPTVSAPSGGAETSQGRITLLQQRQLQSGQIRLRDGQTLILSGIIQESDTTTVSKVPILGDIPILGALFRSTNRSNGRNEVIVLLTPQIVDDSAGSSFGYNYTPGPDARQLLQRQASPTTGGNR